MDCRSSSRPLVDAHLHATADAARPAIVAELVDISDGGVAIDERHANKQPDWSYEASWGGETPVERFIDHRARTELES